MKQCEDSITGRTGWEEVATLKPVESKEIDGIQGWN